MTRTTSHIVQERSAAISYFNVAYGRITLKALKKQQLKPLLKRIQHSMKAQRCCHCTAPNTATTEHVFDGSYYMSGLPLERAIRN